MPKQSLPLTIADLRITLNATFAKRGDPIQDVHIKEVVDAAKENILEGSNSLIEIFREKLGSTKYTVSACVFYSAREAYFLPNKDLYDTIIAYIVIIEIDHERAAIFKKSCGNTTKAIDRNFEISNYSEIINTFDDSRTMIQKLSARDMNISDKGMRSRSYEAPDLKGHMSPHSAGRSIPKFAQIRTKNDVISMSLTTGRINKLADRTVLELAAEWAESQFTLMARKKSDKSFFSSFAQRVSLAEAISNARPANILFERSSIEEDVHENQTELVYTAKNGTYKPIGEKLWKRILVAFDTAYEVDDDQTIVGPRGAKLRVNQKTLSPHSRVLQRIKVKDGKDYETLQSWITRNGYFTVSFDNPEYIYFDKNCFQDRAGRSEIDSILRCLEPYKSFASVTSEKGNPRPADVNFRTGSLFKEIEVIHKGDTYLFCDDFGDEWADHIAINSKTACATFIHSKYSKVSNSASALHEVVGQAIKNLGNMHFNQVTMSNKINRKFKKKYRKTNIQRTRKGNVANANGAIKDLLSDHRLHRKCVIACPSLSKQSVENAFKAMKAGKPVKGHITQLFWILSSFIHASTGSSAVPLVYCQP